jgi:hypothetical protein
VRGKTSCGNDCGCGKKSRGKFAWIVLLLIPAALLFAAMQEKKAAAKQPAGQTPRFLHVKK